MRKLNVHGQHNLHLEWTWLELELVKGIGDIAFQDFPPAGTVVCQARSDRFVENGGRQVSSENLLLRVDQIHFAEAVYFDSCLLLFL